MVKIQLFICAVLLLNVTKLIRGGYQLVAELFQQGKNFFRWGGADAGSMTNVRKSS